MDVSKLNQHFRDQREALKRREKAEEALIQLAAALPQADGTNFDVDKRKAQLAWIRKVESCSETEKKAALLKTEGLSLSEIAQRLPHKNGKAMSRQGVNQVLHRFEKKTGNPGLFSKGTYRDNVRIESEAKESDEEDSEPMDS